MQGRTRPQTCPMAVDLLHAGCGKINPSGVNRAFWLCPPHPAGPSIVTTLDAFLVSTALRAVGTVQPVQGCSLPSVLICPVPAAPKQQTLSIAGFCGWGRQTHSSPLRRPSSSIPCGQASSSYPDSPRFKPTLGSCQFSLPLHCCINVVFSLFLPF